MKYCLPIIAPSLSEVRQVIAKNKEKYDYFEIWLDYIEGVSVDTVKELEQELGNQAIFLFRRKNLEPIKMPMSERTKIINTLEGRAYLDLDFDTQMEERQVWRAVKGKVPLILSYHNYKETPSRDDLLTLLKKMHSHTPAILKLATFCNTEQEALLLLAVILDLKVNKQRSIVLGMGEHGKITRIFGALWGNEFIFAPEDVESASAPGQLTRAQLDGIFNLLNADTDGGK